jgi:hypothetical protein
MGGDESLDGAALTPAELEKFLRQLELAGRPVSAAQRVEAAAPGDLHGVELARPGPWLTKTGQRSFSAQDLRDAAEFFAASGGQAVPVKLGHDDDRFDGEPSFGSVTNIRYTEDDRGPVLLGDIVDMPSWLAASAPKRWPNRSIEGWQNFTFDGREYSLILSGLAFLGVTPPAMRNIRSLTDLQNAIAASSAQRVFASAPVDDLAAAPQTPAAAAGNPEVEESGMDPAKFREALGLAPDASDDEVRAAFDAALPPPTPTIAEPAKPVQASLFGEEPKTAQSQKPAPIPAGMMLVSASAWQQREDAVKNLTDFMAQSKRNERDDYIAKAVQAGKFTPAQKPHFTKMWDGDPDATRAYIDSMTPNSALAVMASGYAGEVETDDFDREYAGLFPPTTSKGR